MQNFNNLTIKELAKNCQTVDEIQEAIKIIFRETLEQALEAELENHLGYSRNDPNGNNSGNSRNGYSKKVIQTNFGKTDLKVPRDRNGEFEPKIIEKYERTTNRIEDQILAMYAKGMSTRDIEDHMKDIYGIDVSPTMVSKITDKIIPKIQEWQSRPLERVYPIVFLDAIHFKVRKENRVVSKAAYTVLGINIEGKKDILGIWVGENESASFWLGVCNDLKNRGVEDILIACKDGLSGFSEAINSAFPKTENQLCVIHEIRNNIKYVPHKYKKVVMKDLKKIYQALTIEEADLKFKEFKSTWSEKYPLIIKSWENKWDELTAYFKYPHEMRKLIYTTNIVEGYHRQLRKVTKNKTTYPTDEALVKIIYLATMNIQKKWSQPIRQWNECISQVGIYFNERLKEELSI